MDSFIHDLSAKHKVICGVCGYLAKKFAWSMLWTRVATLLIAVANPVVALLVYLVLAIMVVQKRAGF